MAESHVVSALANKRAEIAGMIARAEQQIGQFRADLAHMGHVPVKRDLLRHCDSVAVDPRLEPTSACDNDDHIYSHSVGLYAARNHDPSFSRTSGSGRVGSISLNGMFQPRQVTIATRLDPADLSEDRSADRLNCLTAYALSSAPSGTTPCVTYRQSATSNFRATATMAMRLILPRLSPTLSWNHRLRALPG